MQVHRTLFALLSVAASAALLPRASAAPDDVPAPTTCQHRGTEWVDPKVSNAGLAQCPSAKFTLTVGAPGGSGTLTVEYAGCPSFLDVIPGHNKVVQKLHFNAVDPQTLRETRQKYKANCGTWFSAASCTPDGPPQALPRTVKTWSEEACVVVTSPQ
jgi:hypothetical protein